MHAGAPWVALDTTKIMPSKHRVEPAEVSETKEELHPRNRHRHGYDFPALSRAFPKLSTFVRTAPHGGLSIDFADPVAVKTLNQALLLHHYGISSWDIPPGNLCPPVPGRADYLHHLADLLSSASGEIPKGPRIRILDIGVGANCIYPLLGQHEYGWSFVGTDIDPRSLDWAQELLGELPSAVSKHIELRLQASPVRLFEGVVKPDERFDACLCNPPFHDSRAQADEGTLRKLRNLSGRKIAKPTLNFGGQANELWCEGGEEAFIGRMIRESAKAPTLCRWFTSLIAKSVHIPAILAELERARPTSMRTIETRQGQKKGRILAWSFE